jgi:hypothetical protein
MAKRRRSLSGSPAQHSQDAVVAAKAAVKKYGKSIQESERGECRAAFFDYSAGAEAAGEAEAHTKNAAGKLPFEIQDDLETYASAAQDFFMEKCFVKKGSLAGMRRRRAKK